MNKFIPLPVVDVFPAVVAVAVVAEVAVVVPLLSVVACEVVASAVVACAVVTCAVVTAAAVLGSEVVVLTVMGKVINVRTQFDGYSSEQHITQTNKILPGVPQVGPVKFVKEPNFGGK